jgi:hypothetical protein
MKIKIAAVVAAVSALAMTSTAVAAAPPVTRAQAEVVAKRAASREVARYGISLPPSRWTAACYRARFGEWRCDAGAGGGYCSASMYVVPAKPQPIATLIRASCLD